MSTRTTRKIRQSLTNKGFIENKTHHCNFCLYINDEKQHIFTRFSHGEKECGDSLLNKMAKQLQLTREEFNNLIDCPLSQEAYIQILKNKGEI
jgi:hypothetical protein